MAPCGPFEPQTGPSVCMSVDNSRHRAMSRPSNFAGQDGSILFLDGLRGTARFRSTSAALGRSLPWMFSIWDLMCRTSMSSLYKFVNRESLLRILGGSIRFTQPSAFNDPFELLAEIVMPMGGRKIPPESKINVRVDLLAKRRNPPVGELDSIPDDCLSFDPTFRDIVAMLNREIGFFCLSMNSDSLLMWSHYADQYAGAVVEFDATHDFFANSIEIEYRALRPKKHVRILHADEPIPLSELCIKSIQWEYEKEVRIVRRLCECESAGCADPRGFPIFTQKVPLDAIKSVIFGDRMPHEAMGKIYERLKDTKIALHLAAIDMTGFRFRRETIKYPVPLSQMGPCLTPRTANIFSDLPTPLGDLARTILQSHPMSKIVNKPV